MTLAPMPSPRRCCRAFPPWRHQDWHYIDIPFSPDGTPLEQPKSPNALDQLQRVMKMLEPYDLHG